ncbi:MAG: hypothetical protein ABIQ16_02955 [Polyangiaceae bacterium]
MSELRSWFLRNVLEALERQLGAPAVASLQSKLPPRLLMYAALERLRASPAQGTVPLDEGAELLLSTDSILGDGTGKLLENVGADLTARMLSQAGGVARAGDLAGTVARLEAFLEHPFVGVPFTFELRRTSTGFTLCVGLSGHPRATRALRHLTVGAIVATERFAREVGADPLRISAENVSDRSNLSARYLPEGGLQEEQPPPTRRPAPVRAPTVSLSEEVERILRSTVPPLAPSEPSQLAVRVPASNRALAPQPPPASAPSQHHNDESQPPESMTLRVAGRVPAARGPAIK